MAVRGGLPGVFKGHSHWVIPNGERRGRSSDTHKTPACPLRLKKRDRGKISSPTGQRASTFQDKEQGMNSLSSVENGGRNLAEERLTQLGLNCL